MGGVIYVVALVQKFHPHRLVFAQEMWKYCWCICTLDWCTEVEGRQERKQPPLGALY